MLAKFWRTSWEHDRAAAGTLRSVPGVFSPCGVLASCFPGASFGVLTFTLNAAGTGTDLELTYRVSGFAPDGLQQLAQAVDRVLGQQLSRLERFLETGSPEPESGKKADP